MHDHCTLGDPDNEENQLMIKQFNFGLVIQESVFSGYFDAIVGLAYPTMADSNVVPFFDSMIKEGILAKNLFAFHMSMNPDEEDSELIFGDIDHERYVGDITWHPVVDKLFWSVRLDDVRIDTKNADGTINKKSIGVCGKQGRKECMATPDSGTS